MHDFLNSQPAPSCHALAPIPLPPLPGAGAALATTIAGPKMSTAPPPDPAEGGGRSSFQIPVANTGTASQAVPTLVPPRRPPSDTALSRATVKKETTNFNTLYLADDRGALRISAAPVSKQRHPAHTHSGR